MLVGKLGSAINIVLEKFDPKKRRKRIDSLFRKMLNKRISVETKPIVLLAVTLASTIIFVLFFQPRHLSSSRKSDSMAARSFVLWLHGLGDSGPANEPIKTLFRSPEFRNTKWSFPSAPENPVTCNRKPHFIHL